MAKPERDIQKEARVLVDAHFMTDNEAAAKHGISRRTVLNYRKRLEIDPELSQAFTGLMESVRDSDDWDWLTDGIRSAIRTALDFFDKMDRRNPEALRAVKETFEALSQYEQTRRVIDAKLEAMKQPGTSLPLHQTAFTQPNATA